MIGEGFVAVMGCVLVAAITVIISICAIWLVLIVYDDTIEKRKWRNRK